MDFNDFLAENSEKYGLSAEDWEGYRKNVILSFIEDDTGKVIAWYKGIPVFRHRDSEKAISPGDTWICSLDKSKVSFYFATGLQRIDASFMYELKRDQIEEIASIIWKEQRHVIEPLLEDRYKEVMEENRIKCIEDTREKYEEQLGLVRESLRQLEQRDAENKKIIASLQEQREVAIKVEHSDIKDPHKISQDIGLPAVEDIHVRREGPDTISSQFFNRSRYFVHLSVDHRVLRIKPHESGNVICIDNTMVLAGLSLISQFEAPYEMISEYSPLYGGLMLFL